MTVKVKICGITNAEDARAAVSAGADFLGFVLVPESPRYIPAELAADLASALPQTVGAVAVVVNRDTHELRELLRCSSFDVIQLHGDEDAAAAAAVGLSHVWKALALRTPADVSIAAAFPAWAVVADSVEPGGRRGGTGCVGNWDLAARLAKQRRVVLAGGLNPDNIAAAVRAVRPFAVDASSGTERRPGCKDPDKMRAFVRAAKGEEG